MSESKEPCEQGTEGTILGLSRGEKIKILMIYGFLFSVTLVSFILATVMGNMYLALGSLGIICFVLGLRHGADADHIAAIDNTTRKLMQEDKRPLTVGTWFSLGHSVVVIVVVIALVFATKEVTSSVPSLQGVGGIVGTLISGIFLFLIGLINVLIVREIYRIFVGLRDGKINRTELEEELNKKGFINTHFGKLFKIVSQPYQMFVVGFLFGLGFDTATEVLLIGLSVGIGASSAVPSWAVLVPTCHVHLRHGHY